jgi:TPP-dependent indolepyruvate ferredoxin oxidoreductase alpha subunit
MSLSGLARQLADTGMTYHRMPREELTMSEYVLLGDEAVALAAIHAGISSAYGYPGTPSTEIMEYLIEYTEEHGSPFASW